MRGFSLPEMLLSVTIALIAGALLLGILVNNNALYLKQSAVVNEGLGLNSVSSEIYNLLRQAVSVSVSYGTPTAYITGDAVLILQLPAYDGTGIFDGVYDYAIIYQDGSFPNHLKLQVVPYNNPPLVSLRSAKDSILTTFLHTIDFNYYDSAGNSLTSGFNTATEVEANISVEPKSGNIGSSRSVSLKAKLRNFQ